MVRGGEGSFAPCQTMSRAQADPVPCRLVQVLGRTAGAAQDAADADPWAALIFILSHRRRNRRERPERHALRFLLIGSLV